MSVIFALPPYKYSFCFSFLLYIVYSLCTTLMVQWFKFPKSGISEDNLFSSNCSLQLAAKSKNKQCWNQLNAILCLSENIVGNAVPCGSVFSLQWSTIFGVSPETEPGRQPAALPASLHRHGSRRHAHRAGPRVNSPILALPGSLRQHPLPLSRLRPWRDSTVFLQVAIVMSFFYWSTLTLTFTPASQFKADVRKSFLHNLVYQHAAIRETLWFWPRVSGWAPCSAGSTVWGTQSTVCWWIKKLTGTFVTSIKYITIFQYLYSFIWLQ